MTKIGIIGGSGLDNPEILQDAQDLDVETKYGKPSSPLKVGKISEVEVVLLARHGREHTIPPTQVNNQANIQALKDIGCTHIIATTACGSLKKEIGRGDFVVLDQFIDFTRLRKLSFSDSFEPGKIIHTPMAKPFNTELRNVLYGTAKELDLKCHPQGTVVTIEGPRFSTKAESKMFASWGADVINMSIAPECILANEIGLPYAAVAMATDYDCLFDDVPPVTWEEVLKVFKENVGKVVNLLTNVVQKINSCNPSCCCHQNCEEEEEEEINEIEKEFDLKSTIRTIPNWPKEGIMFRDITTLIENPKAFSYCIEKFKEKYANSGIDKIAGIEARGFIFGAALAKDLGLPFVLIRKKGKLPGEVVAQEYSLEYGTDKIEMHVDSISAGDNVLLIDDLLATGGTMAAACQLVEKVGGKVMSTAFVIDLPDLKGAEKLVNYEIFKLIDFEGE
jgi:5'-methylthioadenosine phosphorylase